VVVVACGFRAAVVFGYNLYLDLFKERASVDSLMAVYILFYVVGEICPCIAGWLFFRYPLPGTVLPESQHLLARSSQHVRDERLEKWHCMLLVGYTHL